MEGSSQADLVFEGGGVKGIGLAGAFKQVYDTGYRPACVAGTSAGAITASLVAAGYTGDELEQIVLHEMDFTKFEDPTFLDHFGVAGDLAEFLKSRGMHSGDYFVGWIRELLGAKGKTQFGHLRDPSPSAENRTYGLQVIASDISAQSMLVLPRDAAQLGIGDPDELEIAHAVRMSMSIPVFFEPVIQRDGQGREHTIVDGGLLSNFPVWLFDSASDVRPAFPTFGMLLVAPNQSRAADPEPLARRGVRACLLAGAVREGDRGHDDGGARPLLRRAGELRPHDPDPDARRTDNRVRYSARTCPGAVQLRRAGRPEVPRRLELRRLHRPLPHRSRAEPPLHGDTIALHKSRPAADFKEGCRG